MVPFAFLSHNKGVGLVPANVDAQGFITAHVGLDRNHVIHAIDIVGLVHNAVVAVAVVGVDVCSGQSVQSVKNVRHAHVKVIVFLEEGAAVAKDDHGANFVAERVGHGVDPFDIPCIAFLKFSDVVNAPVGLMDSNEQHFTIDKGKGLFETLLSHHVIVLKNEKIKPAHETSDYMQGRAQTVLRVRTLSKLVSNNPKLSTQLYHP